MDDRLEANRRNWNERTPVHAASSFYDVPGFKAGRNTLHSIERREVGDVTGKTLLHLQCHFGMDTMSWTRLGAKATGVDFSEEAIALADSLRDELELTTRFVRANVYDLPDLLEERFDIVYSAMGVLCWLPDLAAWAQVVARFVKPGGFFYLFDTHPFLYTLETAGGSDGVASGMAGGIEDLRIGYPYFPDPQGLFFEGGEPSYAGTEIIESGAYEWSHSVAEILGAVAGAGLRLEFFHEFPVNCYQAFPGMKQDADGWWRFPAFGERLPQTFSLRARRD